MTPTPPSSAGSGHLPVPAGGGQAPYRLQQAAGGTGLGSELKFWVIKSFEGEDFKETQVTAKVLRLAPTVTSWSTRMP